MKLLLFLLFFLPLYCLSQSIELESTALLGSSGNLPFWFTHNQLGRYASTGNAQSLTEGSVYGSVQGPSKLTLSYGTDLALRVADDGVDPMVIEAWAGISGKMVQLKAGAFAETEQFGGLSSSNGHLLQSLNYRPYPRVQLSTPGFIALPVAQQWLRVSARYEEALLLGERFIERPHLHHKELMIRVIASPTLHLTAGLNHYVFWGGHNEAYGQLPQSAGDYLRYITGSSGGSNFIDTEQINTSGNHLGAYLLGLEKDVDHFHLRLQLSHPFEDLSGMRLRNLRDNMVTLYLQKKQQGTLLDEMVIEYLYTQHQGGDQADEAHLPPTSRKGGDNYFNNSIYRSGFTYLGYSMGTPLFEPLQYNAQGIINGVSNNRLSALHLGAKGCLSEAFTWKTMITLSRNLGTYVTRFQPSRSQLSSLARLSWQSGKYPISLSALAGVDVGELLSDQVGVGIQAVWKIR